MAWRRYLSEGIAVANSFQGTASMALLDPGKSFLLLFGLQLETMPLMRP